MDQPAGCHSSAAAGRADRGDDPATVFGGPSLRLLLRLRGALLRNRLTQLVNQSPLKLLLIVLFIAVIWAALRVIFDEAFRFMRRFEQQSTVAIPYVFHVFFVAMTALLTFSTAVLAYGALFGRAESSFLLATPSKPRHVVIIAYLEALFFASWSLLLLGVPLMFAYGNVQGLPWYFYLTFILAFAGFVPIPGALGLLVAVAVAMWLPRQARRILLYCGAAALGTVVIWWGRLWVAASDASSGWLQAFLAELQYLKSAMLPSTWVTNAIRGTIEDKPADAAFYLAVTISTGLFASWAAITFAGSLLVTAFGRAHAVPTRCRAYSGRVSKWLTEVAFFYLPREMRTLVLKDVRSFLRDPVQWSQLAILFGLLALYLAYLPRSRPEGFSLPWKALICFLNYGAVTLILSTFTSRFVFPLISMEGRKMWLVALWPLSRDKVMWAKFLYAVTVTGLAALSVTALSIGTLQLPFAMAFAQVCGTLTTCAALCGMAIGLGARLPCYQESNSGRIASGLGGTVNLIASVGFVAAGIIIFGMICYDMVGVGDLTHLGFREAGLVLVIVGLGLGTCWLAMKIGMRAFRQQEF
jgi:ABC-2 type transport system permease protein